MTDEDGKLACPPCLRGLARPLAPKVSPTRLFRELLAGLTAFACLAALLFLLLRWRVETPEQHLDLGRVIGERLPEQSHE